MRKIREVLRLRLGHGLAQRAVAESLRLSQGAVHGYVSRAQRAGLDWPLPEGLDDAQLEALLFPPPPAVPAEQRPVPDWAVVHRELRRPNVTLALLWEEYRGGVGGQDGFGYSSGLFNAQYMTRMASIALMPPKAMRWRPSERL